MKKYMPSRTLPADVLRRRTSGDCKIKWKDVSPPSAGLRDLRARTFVRALAENGRPKNDTRLRNAPYWNTDAHGRVCLGSMRVPGEASASTIAAWEGAYFASEFTHPSGAIRLTTHPRGFLGLWSTLEGRERFPARFLADSKQNLDEFIEAAHAH